MTDLANEATIAVEPTPIIPEMPMKPAQGWLGNMPPMVQRFAGAVADTHSAVEKRLGFCPMKELQARGESAIKAVSERLDMLADGLHRVASRMRVAAGATPPKADESAAPRNELSGVAARTSLIGAAS